MSGGRVLPDVRLDMRLTGVRRAVVPAPTQHTLRWACRACLALRCVRRPCDVRESAARHGQVVAQELRNGERTGARPARYANGEFGIGPIAAGLPRRPS